MIDGDIVKKLKEKNYLLEVENEKLKIMITKQEEAIKKIHIILKASALL